MILGVGLRPVCLESQERIRLSGIFLNAGCRFCWRALIILTKPMIERRKSPRIQAEFAIHLQLEKDLRQAIAFVKNISKGGMFFQTKELMGPNDRAEIFFRLPGQVEDKEYRVMGQVVHLEVSDDLDTRKPIYRAGIKFMDIEDTLQSALDQFVSGHHV